MVIVTGKGLETAWWIMQVWELVDNVGLGTGG